MVFGVDYDVVGIFVFGGGVVSKVAVLCPVCKGSGRFMRYDYSYDIVPYSDTMCHGCGGKGWVVVDG